MNVKKQLLVRVSLVAGLLFVAWIALNGCKKSEPEPAAPGAETAAKAAEETASEAAETIEQTTCPVMGGAINKDLFVEYKGKKVYFCCAGCEEQFNKEPEKYVAKLPQFRQ